MPGSGGGRPCGAFMESVKADMLEDDSGGWGVVIWIGRHGDANSRPVKDYAVTTLAAPPTE
jgi:hypothetical protein